MPEIARKQGVVVKVKRSADTCPESNQRQRCQQERVAGTDNVSVPQATPPRLVPRPKTAADKKARVAAILESLDTMYPDAACALTHRNAWELLVATILSAQCTDKRVNEVTPALFAKYPTITDLANATQAELAQDIRSTGFFNNKAKSLIGAAKRVSHDFGGKVPRTIE